MTFTRLNIQHASTGKKERFWDSLGPSVHCGRKKVEDKVSTSTTPVFVIKDRLALPFTLEVFFFITVYEGSQWLALGQRVRDIRIG